MLVIRLLLTTFITFECYGWNLGDLIIPHIGPQVRLKCQRSGELCKFDRHCCAGLECRMSIQDYSFSYFCHPRLVERNYVEFTGGPSWKDYQEDRSDLSEYEGPKSVNEEGLYQRNAELRRKLAELRLLRKRVRQQQLKDVKRRLEEAEIAVFKDEKRMYEEKKKQEVKKLRKKEMEDKLLDMERKEVNKTLSKQNNVYMDMLGDFSDMKIDMT